MKYGWICATLLGLCLCTGCGLSPRQAADLASAEKALAAVTERLANYEGDIKAIQEAVKAGNVPASEGAALIAKILANREADVESAKKLGDAVSTIRESEIPWWYYIGPVATALLGVAGGYIPQARKVQGVVRQLDTAGRMVGAVIHGVEKAKADDAKIAISEAALLAGIAPELHDAVKELTDK